MLKRVVGIIGVLLILLILIVGLAPFFIPVQPLDNLVSAEQAATNESQFITIPFEGTDGIDIHYLTSNSEPADEQPTFVLLHGSLFNAYTWDQVMAFFGEYGRVLAYDQIPYGLSEKLVEGDWVGPNPYTSEAAVSQLFAFLDAQGVNRVILVGNSYGGVVAAQAALAQPERVQALVFVDAAVYVQEEMPAWLLESPQFRRIGPLFARMLGQSEDFVRQTYLNPDAISDERMALTLVNTRITNWDYALWEYLRVWSANAPNLADRISEIQQPALVMTGDSDAIVPVEHSQRLAAALPDSQFVMLPSCGHVPQEECPERFGQAVAEWLNQENIRHATND